MMKRILLIIAGMLSIVFIYFAYRYFYQKYLNEEYKDRNYDISQHMMEVANFNQPYIAYYNAGNIAYQNGDMKEAIKNYDKALELNGSHKKECNIRINKALALIDGIVTEVKTEEDIQKSLDLLYEARDVLLEEDCATDSDTGHDPEAQRLKNEIDELIQQYENPPSGGGGGNGGGNGGGDGSGDGSGNGGDGGDGGDNGGDGGAGGGLGGRGNDPIDVQMSGMKREFEELQDVSLKERVHELGMNADFDHFDTEPSYGATEW